MSQTNWNLLFIGLSFAAYIIIAIRSRAGSTKEFYTAGSGVSPFANGMATAADWMSAATFISMAGGIAATGYDGSRFLMGWTGGFVLLTVLMVPYLRKFNKSTVPDFIGDRYPLLASQGGDPDMGRRLISNIPRLVAILCAIFVCLVYIMGQMRGVGIVFSQLFGISIWAGVLVGGAIVFFYAGLGGMKGITYTQVAQYCVMAFAYTIPAIFASMVITGNIVPQLGFIGSAKGESISILEKINNVNKEIGFAEYTKGNLNMLNMFCITAVLMCGTAGLPHVIVRFFTVKSVKAVRISACWTLAFIAVIYLTAPAVGIFARINLIENLNNQPYAEAPAWLATFEKTGQMGVDDKNGDGIIQYRADKETNELSFGKDIMVMASPYMAGAQPWIIGLLMAGCVAAALSTAAGLLLVLSTSISHDLVKKIINPGISDKKEVTFARLASLGALLVAVYFGINPPSDLIAKTVAFAFGLAASSFFPTLLMGIFSKRVNSIGAILGMACGITFTASYIIYYQFVNKEAELLFGITPEAIGFFGMLLNFIVTFIVSAITPAPPKEVQDMVKNIHIPSGAGDATH